MAKKKNGKTSLVTPPATSSINAIAVDCCDAILGALWLLRHLLRLSSQLLLQLRPWQPPAIRKTNWREIGAAPVTAAATLTGMSSPAPKSVATPVPVKAPDPAPKKSENCTGKGTNLVIHFSKQSSTKFRSTYKGFHRSYGKYGGF